MLLSCVVADAWFLLAPVDTGLDIRLYWLVQPPMDVALSLLSQRVSRLPGLPVPARRFWNLMVLAGVLFAAGDTTQAVVAMTGQADLAARPGLVQQACVILGTGVLLLWLVFHPTGMGSRWAWLSFWLDGVTMMAAAAVFVWYFSFPPAMDTRAAAGAVLGSGVLLVAVSAMAKLILSGASPMTPGPAIAAGAGAVVQWILTNLAPVPHQPALLRGELAARMLASVLIVAAPRIQQRQAASRPGGNSPRRERAYGRVPYLMLLATYALVVLLLPSAMTMRDWGTIAGVVLVTGLILLRQLATFTDNARLLQELVASLTELGEQERRFRSLVQHATEITFVLTATGTITYSSPAITRVLGIKPEAAVGRTVHELLHPMDLTAAKDALDQLLRSHGQPVTSQLRMRHADGSVRWLEVVSTDLRDEPSVGGIVCNARDVTEARMLQDRLREQASRDALTRLANRLHFEEYLSALRVGVSGEKQLAILLIDLDDFKRLNDAYGHHVGDQALVMVANRLRDCVRPGDTIARIGGDEFVVLLPGADAEKAQEIAARISRGIAAATVIDGRALRITASIGMAVGAARDARALLRSADVSMYDRKFRRQHGLPSRAYP